MDRVEFATLYTLQHSLAGHTEQPGGFLHHDVTLGNVNLAVSPFFPVALFGNETLSQKVGLTHSVTPSG